MTDARPGRDGLPVRPAAALLLDPAMAEALYGRVGLDTLRQLTTGLDPIIPISSADDKLAAHADAEVLFTGWGCPPLTEALLAQLSRLRVIFFAGGTIRSWITPAVWSRGIRVVSAYGANAEPVAAFTLGAILLSLKRTWHYLGRQHRHDVYPGPVLDCAGTFRSTVGLVSLGAIGRRVADHLRPHALHLLAHDPTLTPSDATACGLEAVSLAELFDRSDVVSLHTPLLPTTAGMIGRSLLERLRPGATLINTARGGLVREDELLPFLQQRPDVTAVLDVVADEPACPDHPLARLPNVMLTPHIAGAIGTERQRLGAWMIEEFERWRDGQPLRWEVTQERAALLA